MSTDLPIQPLILQDALRKVLGVITSGDAQQFGRLHQALKSVQVCVELPSAEWGRERIQSALVGAVVDNIEFLEFDSKELFEVQADDLRKVRVDTTFLTAIILYGMIPRNRIAIYIVKDAESVLDNLQEIIWGSKKDKGKNEKTEAKDD